jgi:ligand-binding sensor domain-containing protein
MWAATYGDGIMVFDAVSGGYLRNVPTPNNNCSYLFKTREGVIYAGSSSGLFRYDPSAGAFVTVPETSGLFVHSIMQDSYGSLWLSCFGQGIWQKRSSSNYFIKIFGTGTNFPLASEYITSMYEDSHNRMWVATEGAGVFYFSIGDPDLERFYFGHDQGFPSDIACAIIQDKGGRIWTTGQLPSSVSSWTTVPPSAGLSATTPYIRPQTERYIWAPTPEWWP